jgi:hypothetical protein
MVVVSSDLPNLGEATISVSPAGDTDPTHAFQTQCQPVGDCPGCTPVPFSFGLIPDDKSSRRFRVAVAGYVPGSCGTGDLLVEQSATLSFVTHKTLELPIELASACLGVSCPYGQTCRTGVCVSDEVDPTTLQPFDGTPGAADFGATGPGSDLAGADLATIMPRSLDFDAALFIPTSAPQAIAVGDFDHLGGLDFVVASPSTKTVSVFLGLGDGTFTAGPPIILPLTDSITAVHVADMDRDGKLDVVAAGSYLWVLFGKGDGTFSTAFLALPSAATGLAVADLDAKNGPDVAVSFGGSATTKVFLNLGNGNFPAMNATYSFPVSTEHLALADVDGDAKLDLAIVGASQGWFRPGNGTGQFGAQMAIPAPPSSTGPVNIAAGDPSGGGVARAFGLVIGSTPQLFEMLIPLLGTTVTLPANALFLKLADLDNDGKDDALVHNGVGTLLVVSQLAGAAPVLGPVVDIGATNTTELAIGDVDGDGQVDILATTPDGVVVVRRTPSGGYRVAPRYPNPVAAPTLTVTARDIDHDGQLDLVVGMGTEVVPLMGQPGGKFTGNPPLIGSGAISTLVATDFDGDGQLDVCAATSNMAPPLELYRGSTTAPSHFTSSTPLSSPGLLVDVKQADLNRDGHADVVGLTDVALTANGSVAFFSGAGDGSFGTAVLTPTGLKPSRAVVGDFNGDLFEDVAVSHNGEPNVWIFLGDGQGALQHTATVPLAAIDHFAGADLLGNGHMDLLASVSSSSQLVVALGDGSGNFPAAGMTSYGPVNAPAQAVAGDVDGDGRPDVVVAAWHRAVGIYHTRSDGSLASPRWYEAAPGAVGVELGDFDKDGRLDIAVANYAGQAVTILLNRSK